MTLKIYSILYNGNQNDGKRKVLYRRTYIFHDI